MVIASTAAVFSPSVKLQYLERFPNAMLVDAVGSSEQGFTGMASVSKESLTEPAAQEQRPARHPGPRRGGVRRAVAARGTGLRRHRQAGARRQCAARVLQGPAEERRNLRRGRGPALGDSRRLRGRRGRRHDHRSRPRLGEHQLRRREDLSRRGRRRAQIAPGGVRRAGRRRPR